MNALFRKGAPVVCLLALACLRIDVDARLLPRDAGVPDPAASAPEVDIIIRGEEARRPDFARAMAVSKLFYSRVVNESGSPADLLGPALVEALRRCGYRGVVVAEPTDAPGKAAGGGWRLEVDLQRAIALWLPPREFIQTPQARTPGEMRIDFLIHTQLRNAERVLYQANYADKRRLDVFPGQEGEVFGLTLGLTLSEYAARLARELPRAGPGAGL